MIEHVKDVFVTELVTIFCVLMWHGTWTLVDAFYESLMRWEDSVWYSLVRPNILFTGCPISCCVLTEIIPGLFRR